MTTTNSDEFDNTNAINFHDRIITLSPTYHNLVQISVKHPKDNIYMVTTATKDELQRLSNFINSYLRNNS